MKSPAGFCIAETKQMYMQILLEDNYYWNRYANREARLCDDTCESLNATCDELAMNGFRADMAGQSQAARDEDRRKNTGGSCYTLGEWANCNCCSCDSWRGLQACPAPMGPNVATPSCKEGDWRNNARGGMLHGDLCTIQCETGFTTHLTAALRCYDRQYVFDVEEGLLDGTAAPWMCYPIGKPPQRVSGSLQFADADLRRGILSGILSLTYDASLDVAEFVLYWSDNATPISDNAIPIARLPSPRPGVYSKLLVAEAIPAGAKQLLAFPSNAYGRAAEPLSTSILDLQGQPTEPREGEPLKLILGSSAQVCDVPAKDTYQCRFCANARGDAQGVAHEVPRVVVRRQSNSTPNSSEQVCNLFDVLTGRVQLVRRVPPQCIWTQNCEQEVDPFTLDVETPTVLEIVGDILSRKDKLRLVPRDKTCEEDAHSWNLNGTLLDQFHNGTQVMQHWTVRSSAAQSLRVCWHGCTQWPWLLSSKACAQTIGMLQVRLPPSRVDDSMHPLVASPLTDSDSSHLENVSSRISSHISMDASRNSSYIVIADADDGKLYHFDLITSHYTVLPFNVEKCDYLIHGPRGPFLGPFANWHPICHDGPVKAPDAHFLRPVSVRVAPSGGFWLVVDAEAHRIKRIDALTGYVRTVAGAGQASVLHWISPNEKAYLAGSLRGDGGLAVHAHLNYPWDVAICEEDEEIFLIADRNNHRIRKVENGTITTVAGAYRSVNSSLNTDWTLANQTKLSEPTGVDWLPGSRRAFIFVEYGGNRIYLVDENNVLQLLTEAKNGARILPISPRMSSIDSEVRVAFAVQCDETLLPPAQCKEDDYNCYRGCQTQTVSGRTCQLWANTPDTPERYPKADLNNNYCRYMELPDATGRGLFCHTVDDICHQARSKKWERCNPLSSDSSSSGTARSIHAVQFPRDLTLQKAAAGTAARSLRKKGVISPKPELWAPEYDMSSVLIGLAAIALDPTGAIYVTTSKRGVIRLRRQQYICPANFPFYLEAKDNINACCGCAPGTYAMKDGDGSCRNCSATYYCEGRTQIKCTSTQTTYSRPLALAIGNQSITHQCRDGDQDVLPSTICLNSIGASKEEDCACGHGLYSLEGQCKVCPNGVACPAAWLAPPHGSTVRLRNGYWGPKDDGSGYSIYKCNKENQCWHTKYADLWNASFWRNCKTVSGRDLVDCSLGAPYDWIASPGLCPDNRDGFMCGRCKAGYYETMREHSLDVKCLSCKSTVSYLTPIWTCFSFIACLLRFHAFFNNPKQSSATAGYMMTYAATSLVTFLQTFSLLKMIDIEWPKMLALDYMQILLPKLNFNLLPAQCFAGYAFNACISCGVVKFISELLWPFYFILGMGFLALVLNGTLRMRGKLPEKPPEKMKAYLKGSPLKSWLGKNLRSWVTTLRTFKMEKNKSLNTLGFVFCALYVALSRLPLKLIQTQRLTPVSTMPEEGTPSLSAERTRILRTFPDVQVPSDAWLRMLPVGITWFLIYAIGWFAFHCYITRVAPKRFTTDPIFRARHKYFFAKFREDRYWFGVFTMFTALCLNFFVHLSLVNEHPVFQIQIVIMVLIMSSSMLLVFSPYKIKMNTYLDALLDITNILILTASVTGDSNVINKEHDISIAFTLGLCGLSCFLVLPSLLVIVIFPGRWETNQEEDALELGALLKTTFSRVEAVQSKTIFTIMKSLSETERQCIIGSFSFLAQGLILPAKRDSMQELVGCDEDGSWSQSLSRLVSRSSSFAARPSESSENAPRRSSMARSSILTRLHTNDQFSPTFSMKLSQVLGRSSGSSGTDNAQEQPSQAEQQLPVGPHHSQPEEQQSHAEEQPAPGTDDSDSEGVFYITI